MNELTCKKCGYRLSPFVKVCPRCARQDSMPKAPRGTRPRDNSPLAPAPGEEPATDRFAYIRGIVKADPWFGVLLGILALRVILAVVSGYLLGIVMALAIFWGVLNRQYWGYLVALFLSALGLELAVVGLVQILIINRNGPAGAGLISWYFLFNFAANLLTVIILSLRRRYFV